MPRGERGGGSVKKINSPKANFFLDADGGEAPSYSNNHEKKPRNARQLLQKKRREASLSLKSLTC